MAEVAEFDRTQRTSWVPLRIKAPSTARMYDSEENRRLNYGHRFLGAVYDELGIDAFISEWLGCAGFCGEYRHGEVFKFLVLLRILAPDSKRASFQMKDGFYGMEVGFALHDIYRALDKCAEFELELQRHTNERIKRIVGRDLSHAFYDVTNYYCEVDFPDGENDLRQRGVSKEHRVDPVSMGLFMDGNGLPDCMSIFPCNTGESLTLQPTVGDVKKSYGLGRVTVVADKGLNTSKNIDAISNAGDGFVFSQVLRGTEGKRYAVKLFDDRGWVGDKDGTYKYKLFVEEYEGRDANNRKTVRKRKVLLYWDRADAVMAARKREEKLKRAARSVRNNAFGIKKGAEEYTKEHIVDKGTGEVLENISSVRSVDTEKAEKDAMYDGFFSIITSELDYDERKMREVYGSLWKIEKSFRILKSDLYARPIFVKKNGHIRAHFLICFVALLIIRIIQHRMGDRALSAERIARALNAATCRVLKGGVIHLDDVGGAIAFKKIKNKNGELVNTLAYSNEDEIAQDYKTIQEVFGTDCYSVYLRQEEFTRFIKSISF